MTAKKNTGSSSNVGAVVGIAAGVAAMAAAGYFLFGPNGKKNRKIIKSWTIKAKGEVLEKIENMKEVTADAYAAAVEQVSEKYAKLKNVTPEEIAAFTSELARHWKAIEREHAPKKKAPAKKAAPKAKKK